MTPTSSTAARVLVIDDDATVRRALASALGRLGFVVTTADEAVPAMQLEAAFDVVVVDYNMLTANGADVVRHFRTRLGGSVYCVVLSGDDDDDMTARCHAAGADLVMMKPILPGELRRCLTAGLEAIRAVA